VVAVSFYLSTGDPRARVREYLDKLAAIRKV